jgi:hypothetical protein
MSRKLYQNHFLSIGLDIRVLAFWQNTLFHFGSGTSGKAYAQDSSTSTFNESWSSETSASFNFPGATPSVSSNGSSNGIVWVIDSSGATHRAFWMRTPFWSAQSCKVSSAMVSRDFCLLPGYHLPHFRLIIRHR